MDYQHISGVTESINELTQAVTTPSEVSITISDFNSIANSLNSIMQSIHNNHDQVYAGLITAVAVLATGLFSLLSNRNLAKNHADEVKTLKESLDFQKKQHEQELINKKEKDLHIKKEEVYSKAIQFFYDLHKHILQIPKILADGEVAVLPEYKNPNYTIYASKIVIEAAKDVEDFLENDYYEFLTRNADLMNVSIQENTPLNPEKESLKNKKRVLQNECYLDSIDVFEKLLIATTKTINQMRLELNGEIYVDNVDDYAKNKAECIRVAYEPFHGKKPKTT